MSVTHARLPMLVGALMAVSLVAAGCSDGGTSPKAGPGGTDNALNSHSASPEVPKPAVRTNVPKGATAVPVDRRISVTAESGTLDAVNVTSKSGPVPGRMSADKKTWTAGTLLEPGTAYTVRSQASIEGGKSVTRVTHFRTAALSLDQQTYPSIAPLAGQTVGIGMPVIVRFDVPVTNRASIEKHLKVVSEPAQKGSWHWISSTEVHWRPAKYWMREGYQADIVVFDPETIASEDASLVADLPGDAPRLTAGSIGIKRVLVNGVETIRDGVATGAKPGTLLRSGRDTETVATS